VQRKCTVQAFVSWFDTWFTPDGKPVPSKAEKDESDGESDATNDEYFDGQIEAGKTLEGLPAVETRCPDESEVRGISLTRDTIVPKSSDLEGSNGLTVSFTTSPYGPETHWKQTLFVLKEPVDVDEGDLLVGVLRSSPNDDNVRELDVEIHYSVRPPTQAQTRRKSVEARTVQLFAVR
jgi:protein arginine N-methyltransferase 3